LTFRELTYKEYIARPFDKLAENIINTFKFPYVNTSFEDMKGQVISFLMLNLHKYKEGKGKAFSYFSIIAKNYLILHNNNGYKHEKRSMHFADKSDATSISYDSLIDERLNKNTDASEFVVLLIRYWDQNLTKIFKKKRDIDISNAIIELFRRAEGIENFNKKALYLLVREMTNHKTSYITKVVNKMRVHIALQMAEYRDTGTISMEIKKRP
jgi:hypothetical protein